MQLVPGGTYLVSLQLFNAEQLGPSWLVGAFATSFHGADVISVEQYASEFAVVRIRWRKSVPGDIGTGSTISGFLEGLVLPGEAIPSGVVTEVEYGGVTIPTLEQMIPDPVKVVIAGSILVTTWYFTRKIKEKHARLAASSAS
jgi:hypothetical protein